MRVTVEIPDNLIDDLLKVTGERTKTRAICLAIKDYILQKRKEKLLSLSGKIHLIWIGRKWRRSS